MTMTLTLLDRPAPITDATRRQFLAGGAALAALLAGCGRDDPAAPAVDAPAQPWRFIDDLGNTVELGAPPQRVVAQVSAAGALWDLGIRPIGVFGAQRKADGTPEDAIGRVDLDTVESVGEVFGEFNVEALAALQPDLVVTLTYATDAAEEGAYWYVPDESLAPIQKIAPILAISITGAPVIRSVERFAELGAALGADLDAPELVGARQRYDTAVATLTAATAARPGLVTMFVSGYPDALYVAHPRAAIDVWLFDELGLDIVTPDVPVADFWETLSWEQVGRHSVDLIFNDDRGQALTVEQLNAQPTFAALPAVRAGQVAPWYFEAVYSHRRYAEVLDELTAAVTAADPNVV